MSTTQFGVNDNATVKLWSDRIYYDSISDKTLVGMMKKDGSMQVKEDTSKAAGDRVRYFLLSRLAARGLIGDQVATGNEQALTYYDTDLFINQLRMPIAIQAKKTISSQRVNFNLTDDTYTILRNWMIERQTVGVLYQLAGFNPTTFTYDGVTYTGDQRLELWGMNTPTAPTTGRIIRANGLATDTLVAADTTATFKLSYIDDCEAIAEKNRPYIMPLNTSSEGIKYRCYLHTDQYKQAIQDTTAPQQYRDILLAQIAAGTKKEALIGRSFVYSQTEIIATDKIPNGVTSNVVDANARRAVFVGKEAGAIAYGQGFSDGKETTAGFSFNMDVIDIGQTERYAVSSVFGASKSVFNGIDHATVVITTYAA